MRLVVYSSILRFSLVIAGKFAHFDKARARVRASPGSSTDYEPVCGRPHGVRLDRRGQLIVADSYFGLHSVNPQTGEKTVLAASSRGNASGGGYDVVIQSAVSRLNSPQALMAFHLGS